MIVRRVKDFAVTLAAALLIPSLGFAETSVDERLAAGQPPVIIAHRAVGGGHPENSLAGIQHAIDTGIGMVKIDTNLTRDGRYVLMHDPTLNRMTDVEHVFPVGPPDGPTRAQRGGRDYIRDYTLAQIRQLRLQNGKAGSDHTVPTLQEALDLIDGRLLVALDLKTYDVEGIGALLADRGTDHLLFFGIYYSDPRLLLDVSAAAGIKLFIGMSASKDYLEDLNRLADGLGPRLAMVSVRSDRLSPEFVDRAAELGVRFSISGVQGPEDSALQYKDDTAPWLTALDSGAAAVMTGQPEKVLELRGR